MMSNIAKSLCWTAAILLVAIGDRLGLIEDRAAKVLFVVLPVVAVMSLRRRNECGPVRQGARI